MNENDSTSLKHITYKFVFKDNSEKTFDVAIEPKTFSLIRSSTAPPPDWTRLERFACRDCPLSKDEFEYCPIAVNLMDIIKFFSDTPSFEKVRIEATANNRTTIKDTSVQQGVSAVIGIVMVTSGCPVLGKLKPMGRFHLPFADLEETQVRIFSFYLLAQFLRLKRGELPDWNMDELGDLYKRIADINISNIFCIN